MANRRGVAPLIEREKQIRGNVLNLGSVPKKTAPLTEREQRIWRDGLLVGASRMKAQFDEQLEELKLEIERYFTRLACRGVELNPPKVFSVEHPMAKWRGRR